MGKLRVGIFAVLTAAALFSACQERLVEPPVNADAVVDSTEMKARVAGLNQPGGPMRVGGTLSDTMYFPVDIDSFTIKLEDRECAAPNNVVTVVSPTTSLLSNTMCQEPFDTVWSFPNPYDAGEGVVLDFESAATEQMRVSGSFPSWSVTFEDGFDFDFDDLLLVVTAFPDMTGLAVSAKEVVHRSSIEKAGGA